MSHAYSPDQRKVLPVTRCTPCASILRDFQKSNSEAGKSSPTIPTSFTEEKKLAPKEAYAADPPSKSACSSTGVLTVSSAMEPTMRTDMGFGFWFLKAALRHAHTMRCPRPEAILRPLKNFDARAIGTQIVRGQQQFEPAGSPLQLLQPSI